MDSCQIVTSNIVDYSTKLIQQTIKNAIGLYYEFIWKYNIYYYLDIVYEDLNHTDNTRQEWKQPVNQVYT